MKLYRKLQAKRKIRKYLKEYAKECGYEEASWVASDLGLVDEEIRYLLKSLKYNVKKRRLCGCFL